MQVGLQDESRQRMGNPEGVRVYSLLSVIYDLKKNLFYSSFLIFQLSLLKSLAKPTWEVDDGQHCAGEHISWLSGGKEVCTYSHVIFADIKDMEDTILGNN